MACLSLLLLLMIVNPLTFHVTSFIKRIVFLGLPPYALGLGSSTFSSDCSSSSSYPETCPEPRSPEHLISWCY
eukprot:c16449_g3_i1 orf=2-217(-)